MSKFKVMPCEYIYSSSGKIVNVMFNCIWSKADNVADVLLTFW